MKNYLIARTLRNPSPMSPTNKEAKIKLIPSLRQQIWMGVPCATESNDTGRLVDKFIKMPLSWGVRHTLMHYPTDRETTLK